MTKGPKGEKRPADLNRRAFDIVRIASGEVEEAAASTEKAKAGRSGGRARANSLTAEERKEIASLGAAARHKKKIPQ